MPTREEKLKVKRDVNAAKLHAIVLYEPLDGRIDFTDQHPTFVLID